ncbi:MAG: hypothetical protein IH984_15195 [Planctomycetes bacterium]|nr:hypothetical protein [Planctomycetota bacterium]
MPNMMKHVFTRLIDCLALVLLSPACNAAETLRVTVTAEHREIALLEALPVTVKFENVSQSPVQLRGNIFSEDQYGLLVVKRKGDPEIVLHSPAYNGVSPYPVIHTIDPGKSYSTSFTISCIFHTRRNTSIFDKAGRYQLWVEYYDGEITAKSKPISFNVVRPPATEEKALKLVKALEFPVGLYEPDLIPYEHTAKVHAALEEIASDKDSVIYANYARASLAWRHIMGALRSYTYPKRYDLQEEIAEAERLLAAIKNNKFTLSKKVKELRKQFKKLKANAQPQQDNKKSDGSGNADGEGSNKRDDLKDG